MTNTYDEHYQLALSKMAIPTCECLLDDPADSRSIINNKKDTDNVTTRKTRRRNLLAQTPNTIP